MNEGDLTEEEFPGSIARIRAFAEEHRALVEEWQSLWDEGQLDLLRDLNLLAWTLAHEKEPFDLKLVDNWPNDIRVVDHPELRWLSMRDPTIFDLGRSQLSAFFAKLAEGGIKGQRRVKDLTENSSLAAWFLQAERPGRRGKYGDHLARDFLICRVIFEGAYGNDLWQLPAKATPIDPFAIRPSEVQFSEHLFDLLNQHPLLTDLPDAIPSAETIRAVWRSRGLRSDWPMPV